MSRKTSTRKPTRTNLSVLAQLCNLIPGFLVAKTARRRLLDNPPVGQLHRLGAPSSKWTARIARWSS